MTQTLTLICDDGKHNAECETLYALAFGPGRFAKAAARLREGNVCRRDLSLLAFDGDVLIGACRLWPIVAENGVKALFLGPIAVDPSRRSAGLGRRLVLACLAAADRAHKTSVILVGDLSFFGDLGFQIVPMGQIAMPGPVDPKRLLWRVGGSTDILPIGKLSAPRATNPAG